jgi:hypothetical protein
MEVSNDIPEGERDDGAQDEEIIVRADEVDETGTDISTILPDASGDFEARVEARRLQDIASIGSPKILANAVSNPPLPPARPILRREGSAPPPPRQPPPPAPPTQDDIPTTTDSLSLAELRNMVKDFPKSEAVAYAYEYDDTRTFPEELEEWFQYTVEDDGFLGRSKKAFEEEISNFRRSERPTGSRGLHSWLALPSELRETFVKQQLRGIGALSPAAVTRNLEAIAHLAMGVWQETTWLDDAPPEDEQACFEPPNDKYQKTVGQLQCIQDAANILCRIGAIQTIYDALRRICDKDELVSPR